MKEIMKVLKASCYNCESQYQQYGKLCPWRSISGDYCFDGINAEKAQREIKKKVDDFQTKIARGVGRGDKPLASRIKEDV